AGVRADVRGAETGEPDGAADRVRGGRRAAGGVIRLAAPVPGRGAASSSGYRFIARRIPKAARPARAVAPAARARRAERGRGVARRVSGASTGRNFPKSQVTVAAPGEAVSRSR